MMFQKGDQIRLVHGDSHKPLHNKWTGMLTRCNNPNNWNYRYYGAKGIGVCAEWENSYLAFKRWAMAHGYEDGLSLDRIDINKGYCPENCRWVSLAAQKGNTSRNHFVCAFGEKKTLAEWERATGIAATTIRRRLKLGWSAEDAVRRCVHG